MWPMLVRRGAGSRSALRVRGLSSSRRVRRALLLLVGVVSLYLLFPSLVSVFGSWRSFAHLDWYRAGAALLAELLSFVSLWELDRIALGTTSWFLVACVQLSGNAVGQVVPGSGATATAFEVGMLRRQTSQSGVPSRLSPLPPRFRSERRWRCRCSRCPRFPPGLASTRLLRHPPTSGRPCSSCC